MEPETGEDDLQLYVIRERFSYPYYVDLSVSGKKLSMEIDTGASYSIISETQKKAVFPHVPMQNSMVPPLNTYLKEPIPILGQPNVDVYYGKQRADLPLILVRDDGPCLRRPN